MLFPCRLIDLMGGTISVESSLNKGSTFSFTLKFGIIAERRRLQPAADLRGLSILVIDDSDATLKAFRAQLQALSFNVSTSISLEEGIKKITAESKKNPFDLVILDWQFPGISSLEAMQQIKLASTNLSKSGKKMHIITVVPSGLELAAEKNLGKDLESLLIKPFTLSTLLDTIASLYHKDHQRHKKQARSCVKLAIIEELSGARILLVEDNEINMEFATELLEQTGLKVTTAENGLAALKILEEQSFDCILMDVQMPEMDGYTTARHIRAKEKFKNLPIIAMTAGAMTGDKEKALKSGMSDYITKPIDPHSLLQKLKKWIPKFDCKPETENAKTQSEKNTNSLPFP